MSKVMKKTASFVLVISLILSVFVVLGYTAAPTAEAASYPKTHPNTYTNTGAGANDIVGVARTQIGYKENSYGTKYGYWYYPSFVDQPWCAMFVSWCAEQAGIPESVITRFAACSVGINWFKSLGRWYDSKYYGGTYTPKKGDIVFYQDIGSYSPTHVGIVVGLNGNYLHVIEGNATDSSVYEYTASDSRSLGSAYVIGYGNPNYSGEITNNPTDYEAWQVTADGLNMRKSASTDSSIVYTIGYGAAVKVTKVKVLDDYIWGYTSYDGKKGWIALDYCEYICGSIDGTYYQLKPAFDPASYTLYLGDTKNLTPENGLGGTYTSSDKTIAKISSKGKVTALKKGKVTITLTTATGEATCVVKVKNPYLAETEATACIGDSYTLAVEHANDTVTWASANKEIAKVNSKGKVTALKKGVVTITATVSGVALDCTFTVTKDPKIYENFKTAKTTYLKNDYTEMKSLVKLPKGETLKVSEVYYSDTYTWGKTIYSGKEGWVILNKCEYANGTIGGKRYLVKPYLTEKTKSIYIKDVFALEVLSAAEAVTYESADKTVAKVSSTGEVKGVKAGKAVITATTGKYKLTCEVEVKNPELSDAKVGLLKGGKKELAVTGGTGTITYASSDKAVATVSKSGVITAKGFGTATITATRNGIELSCTVNVYDPVLSAANKTVRVGQTKTIKVIQSSGAKVTWKSSDKKLVTVNSKGEITGVKIGNAAVYATVDGVTLECAVRIAKALS